MVRLKASHVTWMNYAFPSEHHLSSVQDLQPTVSKTFAVFRAFRVLELQMSITGLYGCLENGFYYILLTCADGETGWIKQAPGCPAQPWQSWHLNPGPATSGWKVLPIPAALTPSALCFRGAEPGPLLTSALSFTPYLPPAPRARSFWQPLEPRAQPAGPERGPRLPGR